MPNAFSTGLLVSAILLVPSTTRADVAPIPFSEEAAARGVLWPAIPSAAFGYGVAFADLDQDGDPDLVALGRSDGAIGLWENDGTGQFIDRYPTSTIRPLPSASGTVAGDYDGDGDLDLFISQWFDTDVMLRNDGGFVFTEVAALIGLADTGSPGAGSAWGDIDNDGWLDLFLAVRTSTDDSLTENSLLLNQRDGTLAESSSALGLSGGGTTYQGVLFDADRDGDVDLYVSNDKCPTSTIPNRLWRNDGGVFTEISAASGADVCIDSMGVAAADFDGDLIPDLYVTNIQNGNPTLLGQGGGTFINHMALTGAGSFAFGWGAIFFDYDNDGWRELFVANQDNVNRLYDHDGTFPVVDDATDAALADSPALMSYGAAVADIDLDGDLDLAVSNAPGPLRLYVNHEGELRRWSRIRVVGRRQNLHAVGAEIELDAGGRSQLAQIIAGSSYKSQDELTVHFGLDDATVVDQLRVVWPGGAPVRVLGNLETDRVWVVYPPERLGDADGDGDVELDDFAAFAACVDPAAPAAPGCEMMDFDGDGRVTAAELDSFLVPYDGPLADCNANGHLDLEEIVLQAADDLDGGGVPDGCEIPPDPAGAVPDGAAVAGAALSVARGPSTIGFDWGASCTTAADYAVYTGPLGGFETRAPLTCSTAGATTWSTALTGGDAYFLVVARSPSHEGSYGRNSVGVERLRRPGACRPQLIESCP